MLDLTGVNSSLKGFIGGFTDGSYGYFVPNYNCVVARVDLQNFAAGGVTMLNLTGIDSTLKGFWGGFTDGSCGYLVPYYNGSFYSGKVVRIDLHNFNTGGVTVLDLESQDTQLVGFVGGFTDGRFGYFVPSYTSSGYSGRVARVDLQNFTLSGVAALDLAMVDSGLVGFKGGFTDGRFGYFVPSSNSPGYSGKLARVDLQNFSTNSVTILDLAAVDGGLKGFWGGFTDGRFGYFVPDYDGSGYSGKVARIPLFFGGGAP